MPETDTTITGRILEALVDAGVVTAEQVSLAREGARDGGTSADAVLLERGLITSGDVAEALEREMGVPSVDLASYTPDAGALSLVPAKVARRSGMLPLFEIEGMLTVAIGDPLDSFALDGLAEELGLDIEPVLADSAAVAAALEQYYGDDAQGAEGGASTTAALADAEAFLRDDPLAAAEPFAAMEAEGSAEPETAAWPADDAEAEQPAGEPGSAASVPAAERGDEDYLLPDQRSAPALDATPPPPAPVAEELLEASAAAAAGDDLPRQALADALEATPVAAGAAIDLDVLAVADARTVALLVSDILEDAASRGATHVHLLPYKDDFFLVYRVEGRLEKVAAAPRSMQRPLVEGFRSFASVPPVTADAPVWGRVRARLADKDMTATVSVVPTLAGQRVVVGLGPVRDSVPALADLGMTGPEAEALDRLMERGRGLVVVAAPAGGGASTTVASLMASAAASGRTVYSVEREPGYELPAVAQVVADSAAGASAASCLRAGLRQDTDVLVLDDIATAEELGVAMSAAMRGRLVIVAVQASDAVGAVERLAGLGVDRDSLATSLAAVIGQRLVRLVCTTCGVDVRSPLSARIDGLGEGAVTRAGSGCSACGGIGSRGATGVFEVLPVNAGLRRAISAGARSDMLVAEARAAGCRPMPDTAVQLVIAGRVTAEELDRVMRLARI